jgi:hypothetical protein
MGLTSHLQSINCKRFVHLQVQLKFTSMAICPRMQQDQLIWASTKNGMYSVRSAYHLELDRRTWNQSICSMNPDQSEVWKAIWKLKIPRPAQKCFSGVHVTKFYQQRRSYFPAP